MSSPPWADLPCGPGLVQSSSSPCPLGPSVFAVHRLCSCPQQPRLAPDVLSQEPSASAPSPSKGQISYRKNPRHGLNDKASTHLALCLGLAHLSSAWNEGKEQRLAQLTGGVSAHLLPKPQVTLCDTGGETEVPGTLPRHDRTPQPIVLLAGSRPGGV